MPFIQAPALVLWNPHEVHCFEHDPESLDRSTEHRSVGDVERISFLSE